MLSLKLAAAFPNFELTVGELNAAGTWREDYWIYLVARCEADVPSLTRLRDPLAGLESYPVLFRLWATVRT